MSSDNCSSNTSSIYSVNQLDEARIEADTQTIGSSTQSINSKSKQKKFIDVDFEDDYDYRESISQLLKQIACEVEIKTPPSNKSKKKRADLTQTLTIKGKRGKLYEDICPVCLTEFNETVGQLPCKHKFCFSCIEQWSKTSTKCPCCRQKYTKIQKVVKNQQKQTIKVEAKDMVFNQDDYFVCYICNRGDNEHVLLVCDMCDFYCCHIFCDPALNNTIPEGEWICRNCEATHQISRQSEQQNQNQHDHSNQQIVDSQNQQPKPVAARTRSRRGRTNQNSQMYFFQRLRRRR